MNRTKLSYVLFFLVALFISAHDAFAESKWNQTNVPADKVWTIHFNMKLDENTVNTENIYIEDSANIKLQRINVELNKDTLTSITVKNLEDYTKGAVYSLHITDGIKSIEGKYLKEEITMKFEVEQNKELKNQIEIKVNHPSSYDGTLHQSRVDFAYKHKLSNGRYYYQDAGDINKEVTNNGNQSIIKISNIDWAKNDVYHIGIDAGNRYYYLPVSKDDDARTINLPDDTSLSTIKLGDLPFQTDKDIAAEIAYVNEEAQAITGGFVQFDANKELMVSPGKYNIKVKYEGEDSVYTLYKENFDTEKTSVLNVSNDELAQLKINVKDPGLKATAFITGGMSQKDGSYQSSAEHIYISKRDYTNISFMVNASNGWVYHYSGQYWGDRTRPQLSVTDDITFNLDANLTASLQLYKESFTKGDTIFLNDDWALLEIKDGYGNFITNITGSSPYRRAFGTIKFIDKMTKEEIAREVTNSLSAPRVTLPDKAGTYEMIYEFLEEGALPIKSASTEITIK